MTHIQIPETSTFNAEEIQKQLTGNQFALLFDVNDETHQVGLGYAVAAEATEDGVLNASSICSIITGLFLLPTEIFQSVLGVCNQALMMEAEENEELSEVLEVAETNKVSSII